MLFVCFTTQGADKLKQNLKINVWLKRAQRGGGGGGEWGGAGRRRGGKEEKKKKRKKKKKKKKKKKEEAKEKFSDISRELDLCEVVGVPFLLVYLTLFLLHLLFQRKRERKKKCLDIVRQSLS